MRLCLVEAPTEPFVGFPTGCPDSQSVYAWVRDSVVPLTAGRGYRNTYSTCAMRRPRPRGMRLQ